MVTDPQTGEILCELFCCEARRSDQKDACGKNHEHIREFIPKNFDISLCSQKKFNNTRA